MRHWVRLVLPGLEPFGPRCIYDNFLDIELLSDWGCCCNRADKWRWFKYDFIEFPPLSLLYICQIGFKESACFCGLSMAFFCEESIWVSFVFFDEFLALIGSLAVSNDKAVSRDFAWLHKVPSSSLSKQLWLLAGPHALIDSLGCVRATANCWPHS